MINIWWRIAFDTALHASRLWGVIISCCHNIWNITVSPRPENKIYSKSQKEIRGFVWERNCVQLQTTAARVLASVNLIALVLFPSPSPCTNMIRFTGMSKWVILFIHCSCLDPNITGRIKAAESQQEVKRGKKKGKKEKGNLFFLSLFCLCTAVH